MNSLVRVASKVIGAHAQSIEKAVRWICQAELCAQQFRAGAKIHKAAIRVEAAACVANPAIAQIDPPGDGGFGLGDG